MGVFFKPRGPRRYNVLLMLEDVMHSSQLYVILYKKSPSAFKPRSVGPQTTWRYHIVSQGCIGSAFVIGLIALCKVPNLMRLMCLSFKIHRGSDPQSSIEVLYLNHLLWYKFGTDPFIMEELNVIITFVPFNRHRNILVWLVCFILCLDPMVLYNGFDIWFSHYILRLR